MTPRVMITNGGTHSPEKWAEVSTAEIIQIGDGSSPDAQVGRKLELKILEIVEEFHAHVQETEKAQLDEDGDGRLESPLDGQEHDATDVIEKILVAAADTPFYEHFQREDVQQNIRNVLSHHSAVEMDIERSVYADSSDSQIAAEWKVNREELGMARAHEGLVPDAS